jgi:hypothetical protein
MRPPLLAAAWKAISGKLGEAVASRTMCLTPARLVAETAVRAAAVS